MNIAAPSGVVEENEDGNNDIEYLGRVNLFIIQTIRL